MINLIYYNDLNSFRLTGKVPGRREGSLNHPPKEAQYPLNSVS
jgi:hypothetical protein